MFDEWYNRLMKKNKAIKYRIYPNKEQQSLILKTFDCSRFVYNYMLEKSIKDYENGESFCTRNSFNYLLTSLKKEFLWLKEADSTALTSANDNLATAFSYFFKKNNNFPKFRKKKFSGSYTTKCVNGNIFLLDKGIKLPKLGKVKASLHRMPKKDWKLKSATVPQSSDGKFYVSVLFEYESDINYQVDINNAIGLDYASNGLFVDSNGRRGTNHRFYRESHNKLAKARRRLSRMKGSKKDEPKSNNYIKQLRKTNKIHRHIANQRMDNLHKISTEIANQYDIVCVEDLNMTAIGNKGFKNGKATYDNGYGMFLDMLEYKLSDRGKTLVKVDRFYPSSQLCSCCGNRKKLELSERKYICTCGLEIDRDLNAAINIKNEGLRLLA
jgi:transposase, IS605 orfB family